MAASKSPEAQVVRSLKRHLLRHGLGGQSVAGILVDADPSYLHSGFARELEPGGPHAHGDASPAVG